MTVIHSFYSTKHLYFCRCYKCSISFGRKDYLEIHKARVHNEIRIAPAPVSESMPPLSIITTSGGMSTTTCTAIKMSNDPVAVKPSTIMTKGRIFPIHKNPHPARRNIDSLRFGSTTTASSSTTTTESNKPFECTQCNACFRKKAMLKWHTASIHNGHKLKCDYTHCNKSFVKLHELNSHMASEHKEEGSQRRHLCAKCFIVLKLCDMKHHMKSEHGLTNEEIQRKSTVRKSFQSHFSEMPELRPIASPKKSVNTNSTTTTKIAISNVTSLNNIKEIANNTIAAENMKKAKISDEIGDCLPSTSSSSNDSKSNNRLAGNIDDIRTIKKNGSISNNMASSEFSSSSKILEQETIAKLEHTFWDFQTFSCLPNADQMQQWSKELQIDYYDIAQWFIQKWRTRLISKKSNINISEAEIEMKIEEVEVDVEDAGEMVLGL